ncbi:hypothetical protein CWO91_13095 [Bradyrhizobium genosp. SA-3]|uniref:hypothetical protein n=1 Tax=Bradyrhizobium genosp. SA-3 TaxID=508868 RepID=UPI00102942EB|nr:hypothetical protein [Bradyrhizobium genosp. SA-3]RZN10515.1 hypothetical protein CWO91_13095 [Bradyrhizobium genosp. SA-3]
MGKSIAPITSVKAAQASTRAKYLSAGEGDADADESSAGMAVQDFTEVLISDQFWQPPFLGANRAAALVQIVLIKPNAFPFRERAKPLEVGRGPVARSTAASSIVNQRRF